MGAGWEWPQGGLGTLVVLSFRSFLLEGDLVGDCRGIWRVGLSKSADSGRGEWVRLPISRWAGEKEWPRGGVFLMLSSAR